MKIPFGAHFFNCFQFEIPLKCVKVEAENSFQLFLQNKSKNFN